MKFDKAMEIAYKLLALCTCLALVLGVVSCSKSYMIKACAVEISVEEQAGIDEFLSTYAEHQAAIDWSFSSDADGNRSARLQIYGLQQLALQDMTKIYDNMSFHAAPSTVTFSGSCKSALYRNYLDQIKPVQIYVTDWVSSYGNHYICSAPDFEIGFNSTGETTSEYSLRYYSANSYSFNFGAIYSGGINTFCVYPNGQYTNYSRYYSAPVSLSSMFYVSPDSIPTVAELINPFNGVYIGGLGQDVSLPSGTVDTQSPWEYYNDTLLPYLEQNYPTYQEYFVFPNGYLPTQDPTEPPNIQPNLPGGGTTVLAPVIVGSGNIINVDGIDFHVYAPIKGQLEIDGITFQFPLDGSDNVYIDRTPFKVPLPEFDYKDHDIAIPDLTHIIFDGVTFLINPDGSLTIDNQNYTLPIGQPETVASDAYELVYKYEIPTIEQINIPEASLVAPDLSDFGDGLSLVSSAAMDFINDTGLMPFIVAMLSIGVFGYILWKIGG